MTVKIKPRDILRHELIGLECVVVDAHEPSLVGLKGEVVDETRNMLILRKERKERKIPKENATFQFSLGNQKVRVEGTALVGRPEDRIKKHIKRSQSRIEVSE